MSELRRDPIGGRWVIVDTDHPHKPDQYDYERQVYMGGTCPFCYGNESMTPPEIEAIRDSHTQPNSSGWQVRVVANKFPALQVEGDIERRGLGMYDMSNGVGAHEVLIETPYHQKDICDLLNHEVENFLNMYCRRAIDLAKDKRFKYIMVFKNFGAAAGASLEHPHTQLIALPMIPKSAAEEIKGAQNYFEYRERCIFCDIIRYEKEADRRVLLENEHFLVVAPYAPRFSFELAVYPKKHNPAFENTTEAELESLGVILSATLAKIARALNHPDYNLIIHNTPCSNNVGDFYHWHIEFMPVLARVAGFEWGTGFYINPISPEESVQVLKAI